MLLRYKIQQLLHCAVNLTKKQQAELYRRVCQRFFIQLNYVWYIYLLLSQDSGCHQLNQKRNKENGDILRGITTKIELFTVEWIMETLYNDNFIKYLILHLKSQTLFQVLAGKYMSLYAFTVRCILNWSW